MAAKWTCHPGLFASWENTNAQDWSFCIREGAVFHDGEPCTADDIVAYIKGFLDSRDYFGMSWSYARYFKIQPSKLKGTESSAFKTPSLLRTC